MIKILFLARWCIGALYMQQSPTAAVKSQVTYILPPPTDSS